VIEIIANEEKKAGFKKMPFNREQMLFIQELYEHIHGERKDDVNIEAGHHVNVKSTWADE